MTTSTTFFEDLFYGNIKPVDKCFDRNSEYAVLTNLIVENRRKLAAFLEALPHAEKEQELLAQMLKAQDEVLVFSEFNRFIEGFQLGARFVHSTFVLPGESVIRDIC